MRRPFLFNRKPLHQVVGKDIITKFGKVLDCHMTKLTQNNKIFRRIISFFSGYISSFSVNMMYYYSFFRRTNSTLSIIPAKNNLIVSTKSLLVQMLRAFHNCMKIHFGSIHFNVGIIFSSRFSPLRPESVFMNHMSNNNINFLIKKGLS